MVYICSDLPWWDHDETVKKFWRKILIRTQIDYTRAFKDDNGEGQLISEDFELYENDGRGKVH